MSRRRRATPGLVTIYWRDIPAQVTVTTAEGTTESVLLDQRFQVAIDRAATVAGLTESQAYVDQWRRVAGAVEGDSGDAADSVARQIDSTYTRDRIDALIANGGLDPATTGAGNS